jgi:hypothetical protein
VRECGGCVQIDNSESRASDGLSPGARAGVGERGGKLRDELINVKIAPFGSSEKPFITAESDYASDCTLRV